MFARSRSSHRSFLLQREPRQRVERRKAVMVRLGLAGSGASGFTATASVRLVASACVVILLLIGTLQAAHVHRSTLFDQHASVGVSSSEHLCLLCATAMQAWQPETQAELHAPFLVTSEPLPVWSSHYRASTVLVFRVRPPPCAVQS